MFSLIFLISSSVSQNPILPKAAILQATKDLSTLQYVAKVSIGQNLDPVNLVIDLNGPFVWFDCGKSISPFSSHKTIKSFSLECSMAKSITTTTTTGYNSKTCTLQAENTITRMSTFGELSEDKVALNFWDGKDSDLSGNIDQFLFSCAPNLLLKGLAFGAKGMLGLGDSRISLPSQISNTFEFFQRKFSLCLSSSKGAILIGGSPPESEISSSMMYTPLIFKKNEGYHLSVNSIKISGKKLSFHEKGILGTKISTIVPYTTMESKIYRTFVEAYVKASNSMNLTLVPPVAPFEVCFSSKGVEKKRVGPNVPIVDLTLQSDMVKWRIYGRNSMVFVSDEVMCLGFLDGGLSTKDSIVIGGHQLEDYYLEINLGNSMFGFSSSLLLGQKKCSDFDLSREL
ncbi:hypothetical protein ACJIZ3_017628 [Penstemon smallii]|uniref:Peptidase A1 domain-containing protein n=1 Tax=Penstemon smallii TaxID=265156 RepID=A0ABD3SWN6_9LAMI